MPTQEDVIVIGFWVETGKWDRLELDALARTAPFTHRAAILKVDKVSDLDKCHAIFIKKKTIDSEQKLIQQSIIKRPNLIQIDPIIKSSVLYNRKCTFDRLYEVELELYGCAGVKIMPSFSVDSVPEVECELVRHDIGFPLICKPNILTGVEQDHDMIVVFKREHLTGLQHLDKLLLQPLVKHQIVLKVSALGTQEIHVATRPSIDKIIHNHETQGQGPQPPIHFYTPRVAKIREENAADKVESLRNTIDSESLRRLVEIIGTKFNISLFSMDLIIDQSGNAFIIDINSFPGYSGMIRSGGIKHFHTSLLDLSLEKLQQIKKTN